MTRTLISIDPSSTATGIAVFHGHDIKHLALVKPKGKTDIEKVYFMHDGVFAVIADITPDAVVLEVPSHRCWAGNGGAGMAWYGFAVGNVYRTALNTYGGRLHTTDPTWKGTRAKQAWRLRTIQVEPAYCDYVNNVRVDDGADVCDAINLGRWWIARNP